MHNQQKLWFIKDDERVAMAELREQREARNPQRKAPDWVVQYWKQVNAS